MNTSVQPQSSPPQKEGPIQHPIIHAAGILIACIAIIAGGYVIGVYEHGTEEMLRNFCYALLAGIAGLGFMYVGK